MACLRQCGLRVKIFFSYRKHIKRLFQGLSIINLDISETKDSLFNLLNKVIHINNLESGIIRLMITRGDSNKMSSAFNIPCIYISIKPFYSIPAKPVKVVYLDETNYPIIRFTPAIKSMNYLGNMLAKKQANNEKAFEPIFYNQNDIITECAIRNIFYIKNEELLTPSLDLGILSGVMRDNIINVAKKIGISCKEMHIKLDDVKSMDEAFISSTGIGLLPCFWDGWQSDFRLTSKLKKCINQLINSVL